VWADRARICSGARKRIFVIRQTLFRTRLNGDQARLREAAQAQEFGRACDFAARMTVCANICACIAFAGRGSKPIRAPGKGRGDRGTAINAARWSVCERRVFTRTGVTVCISQVSSSACQAAGVAESSTGALRCIMGIGLTADGVTAHRKCDVVPEGKKHGP